VFSEALLISRGALALNSALPGMTKMIISSLQNPRVKHVVRLRDRRDRDREQQTVIEGYRALLSAARNGHPVTELFVCPELFQGENETPLIERLRDGGTTVLHATPDVFGKMAYRDRPEGLLGVAPQIRRSLTDLVVDPVNPPLYLVAEAIEKPGNLGTMLRSADATGVSGLIVCERCTDIFNPNVVRASIGALFSVPLVEGGSEETISWLKQNGVAILAATPHATSVFSDVDMTCPVAVVVGTEQYGLSDMWLDASDCGVRIPMLGQADSLNVATASAVMLYEAVRQRGEPAAGQG